MTAEGTGLRDRIRAALDDSIGAGCKVGERQVDAVMAAISKYRPPGEPLTHFFHCWRFPDHHACAEALIERQSGENDRMLVQVATLERALREQAGGSR